MTDRVERVIAASVLAWIAGAAAGCEPPVARSVCQVPGQLGAGAFTAHDCRLEDGCLDGWHFAAGSVETLVFCTADGREVTEVVSSDPGVMVVAPPLVVGFGEVAFDLAAGGPGTTTIEVRGPDVLERLDLVVEDIAAIEIAGPARVALGGKAAITSTKTGGSGAPLFGRGGYEVTLPDGLSARPATTATQDCELAQPDIVISADVVGRHRITTAAPAPAGAATIDVVPADTVTSARFTTTRIAGSATDGYGASVRVDGLDAAGQPIAGVACDWTASRPVFIARNVCWSFVLMSTSEPLDLTCAFHGRDLGTVRLTNTIVL